MVGLVRHEPAGGRLRVLNDAEVADHPSAHFYRFTLAEEFAHILLHQAIMTRVRNAADLAALHDWSGYATIDRNAKRLARRCLVSAQAMRHRSDHVAEDLAASGCVGYLTKPISRELLREALRHYLLAD